MIANTFVAISSAGPNANPLKSTREQPFWDEHVAFIDQLVEEDFILMGGPLVDEAGLPHGALLIVSAERKIEARSLVRARDSETGKRKALGNLRRYEGVDRRAGRGSYNAP